MDGVQGGCEFRCVEAIPGLGAALVAMKLEQHRPCAEHRDEQGAEDHVDEGRVRRGLYGIDDGAAEEESATGGGEEDGTGGQDPVADRRESVSELHGREAVVLDKAAILEVRLRALKCLFCPTCLLQLASSTSSLTSTRQRGSGTLLHHRIAQLPTNA